MNFGHVYDRVVWMIVTEVSGILVLRLLYDLDGDFHIYSKARWMWTGGLLMAGCALCLYPYCGRGFLSSCGVWLTSVYLGVSTTMDVLLKQVSDVLHYMGLLGVVLLFGEGIPNTRILWELLTYVVIQYLIFAKMYGRADVVAFS